MVRQDRIGRYRIGVVGRGIAGTSWIVEARQGRDWTGFAGKASRGEHRLVLARSGLAGVDWNVMDGRG